MADTIHVELPARRDGEDLVGYMSARGLAGTVIEADGACELEVDFRVEREEQLRNEVREALRDWVAERNGSLVLAEVEVGRFMLRPPGE